MNTLESIYRLVGEAKYNEALDGALLLAKHIPTDTNLLRVISFCQVKLGLFDTAIEGLASAINSGYANNEVYISLAFAYAANGQLTEAQRCIYKNINCQHLTPTSQGEILNFLLSYRIKKALVKYLLHVLIAPINIPLLKVQLTVAKQYGLYEFVLRYSDQLLSVEASANTEIDKAIALRYVNRPKEALVILKKLTTKISHYAVQHNLGNAYSDIGDFNNAVKAYKSAITLNAKYVESHVNLSRILWEMGNTDTYLDSFSTLLTQSPIDDAVVLAYVNLLLEGKQFAKAETFLKARIGKSNKSELLSLLLSKCLRLNKRGEQATSLLDARHTWITDNPAVQMERLELALSTGDISYAKKIINSLYEIDEYHQIARANQYVIDRLENVSAPLDLLVGRFDLAIDASQLKQLQNELIHMHGSVHQPINQTVQSGKQTRGNLFPANTQNLKFVESKILTCVKQYVHANKGGIFSYLHIDEEPELYQTPEFAGSWSILIKEAGGFHSSHYHSKAQVSGVLYIKLPNVQIGNEAGNAITSVLESKPENRPGNNPDNHEDNSQAACLHFGQVDKPPFVKLPSELIVEPKEGTLVLFPSHVWHGTVPTASNEKRLTIAFDITF
ncbi:putative 2OG-Fe(II) oxygenase [Alteromonas sp. 1_MG-2023]|uniref:putative 2OG-Fe(II) oxygenase n=1 Tax=Alteromonas sp. 1_MG-2023 TaxID=3062669 RepID=UPI0026E29919|nr:putative 2OG-Fe(II) oxygenase [Alteromonas sp. 1_MG-2023]MDO6567187.1 putative 2OG-Fe(II) oxygenase [Alteromonas sp. 1_MG-2023]